MNFVIKCLDLVYKYGFNLQLYDLMTMAFKYQVSLCLRPNDVLLVTLNHMDMIRDFVEEAPPIKQQVEHVYRLLAQVSLSVVIFFKILIRDRKRILNTQHTQ